MADEGLEQIPRVGDVQPAPNAAKDACSDSSEAEAASAVKGRQVMREWELLGSWDTTSEESSFIQNELERIAQSR